MHAPVVALQRAAVAQALPVLSQPFRFALQVCGWFERQRTSPTAHVGVSQRFIAASQSAAVAQVVGVSV